MPKNLLRVGFSLTGTMPILGDAEDSVCFDSEGNFLYNKKRIQVSPRFGPDSTIAVILNLDPMSPNMNTVSLFKDGQRIAQPQALPDSLIGKPLFPAVTFKNMKLHYNFGGVPVAALPFKCLMLGGAVAKHAKVSPAPAKDAQGEVLFPVCLPDEGSFDWLDMFLAKNPQFIELSDRAILKWAELSGLQRPVNAKKTSNDKPEMGFGIQVLDDSSIRRVLAHIAPLQQQQRSYVVMEVKDNLVKESRDRMMAKWAASSLKKTAVVIMGEPPAVFKKYSQELTLTEKQAASDAEFRKTKEQEKLSDVLEHQRADGDDSLPPRGWRSGK